MNGSKNCPHLREHIAQLDNLSRPDGSAVFCQGKTTVQSAVYGPTEVMTSKEKIDQATLDVIFRPIAGQAGCSEKLIEKIIRNTMENVIMVNLHPRTAININVQVMCDSGSLLSCCINSACLAVSDAGLSMKYFVAAVTCAIAQDGQIITDPNSEQEQEAKSIITIVFDSNKKEIVTIQTSGSSFSESELKSVISISKNCCEKIFNFYRETSHKRLSKEVKFHQIAECINHKGDS